jgi:ABC-type uncharacterized transport system auxiliary subunit
MTLTKSQMFKHAHAITRCKNVAYFGGYQKAFAIVLKQCYADKLAYGFNV